MPFVSRDDSGRISAVSLDAEPGFEACERDDPQLVSFLRGLQGSGGGFEQSDMRLVRVLEDLIDLLIARDVVRFTDFPDAAQEKLLERRSMRHVIGALHLLDGSDEVF